MLDEDLGLDSADVEESMQDLLAATERLFQPGLAAYADRDRGRPGAVCPGFASAFGACRLSLIWKCERPIPSGIGRFVLVD